MVLIDYIVHICIKGDVYAFSTKNILISAAYDHDRPLRLVVGHDEIDRASRVATSPYKKWEFVYTFLK